MISEGLRWACVLQLFFLAGCLATPGDHNQIPSRVKEILDQADSLELISLSPDHNPPDDVEQLHGWEVLGRTTVNQDDGERLRAALYDSVAKSDGHIPDCFWPRHALRATAGDTVTEVLICFECLNAECFVDGQKLGAVSLIDASESTFDNLLVAANVPLAPKPK